MMTFPYDRVNSVAPFWRAVHWIQVDRPIILAILGNIAALAFGPVTAFLIATHFSPELQGYYYTFGSLSMLQFLLDLGFGQAVIQFASHEWAKLGMNSAGRIVGAPDSLSRLISLGRISCKWYGLSAGLLIMGLGPAGYFFFSAAPKSDIQWVLPWFALCIGIPLQFALMPAFYLMQGCNQVASFWFYRLFQRIINDLSLWAAILLGAKLWAGPISIFWSIIWSCCFLWQWHRGFVASFLDAPGESRISWRTEVWPVQWRMAISWMSANFIIFLFAPLLFQLSGPVVAGQMGLTVALNSVLLAIAANWVVTKAPRFGILIAKGKYKELDHLFLKSFSMSLIVVCCGAAIMWVLVNLLYLSKHPLASRILPPLPTGLFLVATILNSVILNLSIYLRAHKKEPLANIYLVSSILVTTFVILLGVRFGATGVTIGYLVVVALFQLPASVLIFRRRRRVWHEGPYPILL